MKTEKEVTAYIDCEGDDHGALPLLPTNSTVYVAFGNEEIRHTAVKDKKDITAAELESRQSLVRDILPEAKVLQGGASNNDSCDDFVDNFLGKKDPQYLVHTASFKPLQSIFSKAKPSQLKDCDIITYASVNLTWALGQSENKAEMHKAFFDQANASGARVFLVEAFPILGTKNKISPELTPLTFQIMSQFDTKAGRYHREFLLGCNTSVRSGQADKAKTIIEMAKYLLTDDYAGRQEFLDAYQALLTSCGNETLNLDLDLRGENYNQATAALKVLFDHAKIILDKVSFKESFIFKGQKPAFDRILNILTSTLNPDKYLLADQLATIILSELREGRGEHGLTKEFRAVKLSGYLQNRFAQYADDPDSAIFYADLVHNTKVAHPELQDKALNEKVEQYRDGLLKYIDFCLASHYLHSHFLSPTKQFELKLGTFCKELQLLAQECRALGFELPKIEQTLTIKTDAQLITQHGALGESNKRQKADDQVNETAENKLF